MLAKRTGQGRREPTACTSAPAFVEALSRARAPLDDPRCGLFTSWDEPGSSEAGRFSADMVDNADVYLKSAENQQRPSEMAAKIFRLPIAVFDWVVCLYNPLTALVGFLYLLQLAGSGPRTLAYAFCRLHLSLGSALHNFRLSAGPNRPPERRRI